MVGGWFARPAEYGFDRGSTWFAHCHEAVPSTLKPRCVSVLIIMRSRSPSDSSPPAIVSWRTCPPRMAGLMQLFKAGDELNTLQLKWPIWCSLFLFRIEELGQSVAGKVVAKCLNKKSTDSKSIKSPFM